MNLLLRVLLAGALVLSAGAVRAEPASPLDPDDLPPPPGYREPVRGRHDGFFAQLGPVGLGHFETRGDNHGRSAKLSGVGSVFSAAVGANVVENLVLGAELWLNGAASPTLGYDRSSKSLSGAVTALAAIGPRLTYYFMPENAFVSVTPSIGTLLLANERKESWFAHGGFALRVAAGGESWISEHWALGLNVHLSVGSNVDGDGTTWTSRAIGVGVTVTRG
jgi:hypothetical protein